MFGGGQQHGGVTIMAAGVHSSAVHARVSERVVLRYRQRVDVSAQPNGTARAAVFDYADHTGFPQAPMHRDAPGGQCPGDQIRGPLLLKTKFGMRMNVPSQGLNSGYLSQDWLNQFHVELPVSDSAAPAIKACGPSTPPFCGAWLRPGACRGRHPDCQPSGSPLLSPVWRRSPPDAR